MAMAAHTTNKNVVGSPSSCTTYDHDHDQTNKKRKRDDFVGRRRNNNWGRLTSHSVETNVVSFSSSIDFIAMASHNNNINNNVVATLSSCNNKPYDDHAHTNNKRKRDHAPPEKRKRKRRRNNNSGKLTFNPYQHDTNDVCLCLSLSCRHLTATTTHDDEKKKTCNDDSTVGKHSNLKLLQPIHDPTVCLHCLLSSPSCGCNQIDTEQKLGEQEIDVVNDQQWEIKKFLTSSDICPGLIRLMLNKDLADKFIIPHLLGGAEAARKAEGVQVKVWDFDEKELHSLVFKIWASDKYYVFTKTWIREFVERRKLKKGDRIGLRWDQLNNRFDFSVLDREILVCNYS